MNTAVFDLPLAERIALVEALWDSIAAEQENLTLSPAHKQLLDERLDAYEQSPAKGEPYAQVLQEARQLTR